MLGKGELSSGDFLDCVLGVLDTEQSPGVVEPFFGLAVEAAEKWSPTVMVPRRLAKVAEVAVRRADEPEHRKGALKALASSATTPEQFDLLDAEAVTDNDLAWRVMVRRASLGRYDEAAVEALLERDLDPEAHVRAWGVTAARPLEEAKAEIWEHIFSGQVPAGTPLLLLAQCFWRPVQHELLVPWAHRYLDEVAQLPPTGLLATGSMVRHMRPTTCDEAWLAHAQDVADAEGLAPAVRTELLIGIDVMTRVLDART
jgi:aminopeptidase N